MLSLKLAYKNISKGLKSFAPFLLASITMFVLIFVTASIANSPSIEKMRGGAAVGQLMSFGMIILAIFGTVILIYSYRFLQLQRSKEFGLYDILGFGKSKIAQVSFFELVISYLITVVLGTIAGIAFAKFLFLIFVNLIGAEVFNLEISLSAISLVAFLFLVYFFLLFLIGTFIIWKSSSLDLLRESSKGEKEPKSNIIFALIAMIFVAWGYYIALSVENPVKALTNFFFAVVLVIIGTYLFYISFTVWYLKWKKKQKSYYKPQNFITTSSMLYRMKANAAGLGNITILLSMSLVTVVVTLGMFIGTANMLKQQFPKEGQVITQTDTSSRDSIKVLTSGLADQANVKISDLKAIKTLSSLSMERHSAKSANDLVFKGRYARFGEKTTVSASATTASDVKELTNQSYSLKADEVVIFDVNPGYEKAKTINLYGKTYKIAKHIDSLKNFPVGQAFGEDMVIIFANDTELNGFTSRYNQSISDGNTEFRLNPATSAYFDIAKSDEKAMTNAFKDISPKEEVGLIFLTQALSDQRQTVGGFVFIGFVLGLSFILGAALIIYYKQLSEGEQDKRSFKILQEVGLSKEEVQKTIQSQVRMIFFLPILITIIHFLAAYKMIYNIDRVFGVTDKGLMAMISVAVILGMSFIYWIIYKITSRVYYKIVER